MDLKKLLTAVVFVLGAWMSVGVAQAQTNYDFSLTFGYPTQLDPQPGFEYLAQVRGTGIDANNNGILSSLNVTSIQTVTPDFNFVTYVTTYSSTSSATILFDPSNPAGSYMGTNYYAGTAGPVSLSDLTFTANGINYSFGTTGPIGYVLPPAGTYVSLLGDGVSPNLLLTADYGTVGLSTTVSPSVAAPEINGSLAPKVGFLLGCLFLMFGRKKQKTEPMLAA